MIFTLNLKFMLMKNIYFKYLPPGESNKIDVINPLEMKRYFFHMKTQFVPRIKHSLSIACFILYVKDKIPSLFEILQNT